MTNCEYYDNKTAFDTEGGFVYCGIPRGKCPHGKEGHRIEYQKENLIICKMGGLAGKTLKEILND